MPAPLVNGTVSTASPADGSDPIVFSHTVASGLKDSYLIVVVMNKSNDVYNAATWNGTPMTYLPIGEASPTYYTGYFYLKNPEDGTHDVSVTTSGTPTGAAAVAFTVTGAVAPRSPATAHGNGDTASTTVTAPKGDCLMVYSCAAQFGLGHDPLGGETEIAEIQNSTSAAGIALSVGTEEIDSGTEDPTVDTNDVGASWQISAFIIPPASNTGSMFLVL